MLALFQDPGSLPRAPVLTVFRSASLVLEMPVAQRNGLELPRWNVRMFFPAQRKGFGKFIYAFR